MRLPKEETDEALHGILTSKTGGRGRLSRWPGRARRRLRVAPAAAAPAPASGSSNSITVAVAYPAPPKALLDQFTKQTGIKVNWVNIGWDDLQTKIAAAAAANTYFADAADVDWSKVGEYEKTGWF